MRIFHESTDKSRWRKTGATGVKVLRDLGLLQFLGGGRYSLT